MAKRITILLPDMLEYHNELLKAAFAGAGYHLEIMEEEKGLAEFSLPYLSGDYCLPAILILGQMLAAIKSGKWDLDSIAFMEPQTGGACRAGNYYNSMIESLKKAGYETIPVISLNAHGLEKRKEFSITLSLLKRAVAAVCYGDLLMTLLLQTRPYEKEKGATEACYFSWMEQLVTEIKLGKNLSQKSRKKRYREITESFSKIAREEKQMPKVGITGEIYIKFSKIGNDHLEDFLQKQGCDYRLNGFINYFIYLVDSEKENEKLKGVSSIKLKIYESLLTYLKKLQMDLRAILLEYHFQAEADFDELKRMAKPVIAEECNIGDGWLIAGEAVDLIEKGYQHILIVHPFGCLVSHVCERGIMKKLHKQYPHVQISTIEYDYDSSKALRESRILLGISGETV